MVFDVRNWPPLLNNITLTTLIYVVLGLTIPKLPNIGRFTMLFISVTCLWVIVFLA